MKELPEIHQQGMLSIENQELLASIDKSNLDFGIQVSVDGRVWVCLNGIAFLRFKPFRIK